MDSWTELTKDQTSEIFTALPESGAGPSKSINALKYAGLMFGRGAPILQYWCSILYVWRQFNSSSSVEEKWQILLNLSVWLPGVTCHGAASTHWEGKCWSRPLSWPWRSLRSVWEPAGQLGCSLFVAALGSDSPAPPWKPEREEQREELRGETMSTHQKVQI